VKRAFPYVIDFIGALIAYTLWMADHITVIGVIAIIVSTALLATCWILYFETEK
jgi:hypothetical protein